MNLKEFITAKRFGVCLAIVFGALLFIVVPAGSGNYKSESNHRVNIAFGFHVNLYHSFRNDTNDESGFGKDIRIIRHIIRTLDRYNQKGVPVRGVWDFDNLFSLQEILPQYAPDIIADIQRRVQDNGDEVILMSYNNGLVSAMTPEELNKAVAWSISNPWQSGVKDLFGRYTPIVRPQEMMTTPGNFAVYKAHGIQAVALYYSATPFDAFRVFSRPLTRAEAHNPLFYRNATTREEVVVIPTYHFGDLMEHVSLKHWVEELRSSQNKETLDHDVLIFINFDADSQLWSGVDLPWVLKWLPGTGGLGALIKEVYDLPYTAFTTLGEYLDQHEPVGTIAFNQDTADGSYNGYNSWAEKADAPRYWTTIQRNRRMCEAARSALTILKDDIKAQQLETLMAFAEMKRLRALSTTNFGMATPFPARQREEVMADLMRDLDGYSEQMEQLMADGLAAYRKDHLFLPEEHDRLMPLDTVMVLTSQLKKEVGRNRFVNISPPEGYRDGMQLILVGSDGKTVPTVNLGLRDFPGDRSRLSLYINAQSSLSDGIYQLCAVPTDKASLIKPAGDSQDTLSNGSVSVHFEEGRIAGIYLNGVRQVDGGSFTPYLKWDDDIYRSQGTMSPPLVSRDGQSISFQIAGPIPGPKQKTVSGGWMDYRFTLIDDLPYLLLQGKIQYPTTEKEDLFKAAVPGLMRRIDNNWQEIAPAEIQFSPRTTKDDPIRVLKQNYLGIATQYSLDYFRHSDSNLNLDNINNHITESYVGVVSGDSGMAVAMDTSVQANFAFAPLKMKYDETGELFSVSANPFGTYTGNQYTPFTRGNRNGFEATLLAGEQFAGAAPTYNGVEQYFSVMVAFFNARQIPESIRRDLIDYAVPPTVISASGISQRLTPSLSAAPCGLVAAYESGTVRFSWDNDSTSSGHYRIFCGSRPGHYEAVYPAVGNSLRVNRFRADLPFNRGQHYYAVIERISANGKTSPRAEEIKFTIRDEPEKLQQIPLILGAKIVWANLLARLSSVF